MVNKPLILFLAGLEPDYLSAALYRGMVDILGWRRVIDLGYSYYLHNAVGDLADRPGRNITCEEIGRCDGCCGTVGDAFNARELIGGDFVFVVNNSHLRDTDGSWVKAQAIHSQLPASSKVAYVIGDDHTGPYSMPPFPVDAVFQREISVGTVGREPLPLCCLESWIAPEPQDRPIDLFYAGSPTDQGRSALPRAMAELSETGLSVVCGSGKGIPRSAYMEMLRKSKMAVCPTGGGNCSDTLRIWEAIASGALPIFPSHPKRLRGDLDHATILDFDTVTWDNFKSRVLMSRDVKSVESALIQIARKNTTTERARKVLQSAGYDLETGVSQD